jgi:hypothetical protein
MSRIHWRAPTLALALMAAATLFMSCGKLHAPAVTAPDSRTAPLARPSGSGGTQFSGQATAVRANVLGINAVLSDAGPLPPSGGAEEKSLLTATVPGTLTANVLHATTIGQGDRSRSEASVADLDLTVGGQTVTASFLMARAQATCTDAGPQTSGSSEIANLSINGQSIVVSGSPNQTILLPAGAGQVVINEQSGSPGDITVNALHVVVTGVADVVVSSAHADITCHGKPTCTGGDFVTGGGWITGTPSGAKGTFAVAGGIKNGAFWGHLTYLDHGNGGPKVKGTGVTSYTVVGPTTRRITGTCEIDGQSGFTYRVDVSDNGEPGRNDTFSLNQSSGYSASGTLAGGNIQLHMPCH